MPKTKKVATKGLTPKMFTGLNKKRFEKTGGGNFGKRLRIDKNKTIPIQFLESPTDFCEYEIHVFQDDGRWEFIPCAGDSCPLCSDEDELRSRTSYRFCCNIYNLKDRKVQIMEGPKDLASRIFYRYERKPDTFLKRTYEVTKFAGTPITYDFQVGEDAPVKTGSLTKHDLNEFLIEEMKRYFGPELVQDASLSSLEETEEEEDDLLDEEDDDFEDELEDDEDEEEVVEEEDDEDDLLEDDDDEDFDLDDLDDEDEDEEPVKKAPAKKVAKGRKKKA